MAQRDHAQVSVENRTPSSRLDAVVVGSGPNGLAAAILLARHGLRVRVIEAEDTIGGGTRTDELTLPGFRHDVCSAVHPLAAASPFFESLALPELGVKWVHADQPLAHPLKNQPAVLLHRSIEEAAAELGSDAEAYRAVFEPIVTKWRTLCPAILSPLRGAVSLQLPMLRFGLQAVRSAESLCRSRFRSVRARALFGGLAAHGMLPLDHLVSAAFGLVLGAAGHAVGWPFPEGGADHIAEALACCFRDLGGEIETGLRVSTLNQLPKARVVLLDLTPRQVLRIARNELPPRYARKLEQFHYGPGVFKLDLALAGPIPWQDKRCTRAATVHLGGTFEEIAQSESAVSMGRLAEWPFVILAQHSLFDPTRSPTGRHTVWAYCHVPHGSPCDMTEVIENRIEGFAPGFRDLILARHAMDAPAMEAHNANYIGGDITGGMQSLGQLFRRPVSTIHPYHIPGTPLYICSSSTPPGGGVHGMCGYHAARSALRREFGLACPSVPA